MDIARETERYKRSLRAAIDEAEAALARIEAAGEKTAEVLAIANEVGVKTVGLGRRHASLGNLDFPFGGSGHIYTPKGNRTDGWPSAWHIARKAGIADGAGNSGQHQIPSGACIDGVYRCIKGVWTRIEGS